MICFFVISTKKIVSFWVWSIINNDPFFVQIGGPKKHFLKDFTNFFSELMDCTTQVINIILIESPNIFHWKSAKKK